MSKEAFVEYAKAHLADVGLKQAELVSASYDSQAFGNALAIFEIGPVKIRLVRDRSQQFLEFATPTAPNQYFGFHVVEIAMGWSSVENVVARDEVEAIGQVLRRLSRHIDELKRTVSDDRSSEFAVRLEQAQQKYGDARWGGFRGRRGKTPPP